MTDDKKNSSSGVTKTSSTVANEGVLTNDNVVTDEGPKPNTNQEDIKKNDVESK